MRILISGSHGFIGSACVSALRGQGHEIVRLVRSNKLKKSDAISWNPSRGEIRKEDFEGFDAIIHLAGKNIFSKRWSKRVKNELFLSRCRDTWLLSEAILRLDHPPTTFITASAIGFYGDRGEEILTEDSSKGPGFLPDLVQRWESAVEPVKIKGVRVICARFGVVLSPKGGMLAALLPFYKMGLGTILGSGTQWVSWIGLADLLKVINYCLKHKEIEGVVNAVAPFPIRQKEFSKLLAERVHKKIFLKIPSSILKFAMGEMADALALASTRVSPCKLLESGYTFFEPKLDLYFKSQTL